MKCKACKQDFYPVAHETFYDSGKTYRMYCCSWCGEENYYEVHRRGHFNKARVKDLVSEIVAALVVSSAIYYVLTHLDKFCTT
jgi:protein-arginine kinase activator protein McsA